MAVADSSEPHAGSNTETTGLEQRGHELAEDIRRHMSVSMGHADTDETLSRELFKALGYTLRDSMLDPSTQQRPADLEAERKQVHYLSLAFLIGRTLSNAVDNLGLAEELSVALRELGVAYEELAEED